MPRRKKFKTGLKEKLKEFSKREYILILSLEAFILLLINRIEALPFVSTLELYGFVFKIPSIFLGLVFISGIWFITSGHYRNVGWKVIGAILLAILTLQVISPMFVPKISTSDIEFVSGEIRNNNGVIEHNVIGRFEVKVRPPLFPIDNSIEIPLGFVNLTKAWYEERFSPLFSQIYPYSNTSVKFWVLADGWRYEELSTKIAYKSDVLPRLNALMYGIPNGSTPFKIEDNNREFFYDIIHFYNYEDFKVCFWDSEFKVDKNFYQKLKDRRPISDYSVMLCDAFNRSSGSCSSVTSSTDGLNFSQGIKYRNLNSEFLILKPYVGTCLEANTTLTKFFEFEPYVQ